MSDTTRERVTPAQYQVGDQVTPIPTLATAVLERHVGQTGEVTALRPGAGIGGRDLLDVRWPDGDETASLVERFTLVNANFTPGEVVRVSAEPYVYADGTGPVHEEFHGATVVVEASQVGDPEAYRVRLLDNEFTNIIHRDCLARIPELAPGTRVRIADQAYSGVGAGFVPESVMGTVGEVTPSDAEARSRGQYVVRAEDGGSYYIHGAYLTAEPEESEEVATEPPPEEEINTGSRVRVSNPAHASQGFGYVNPIFYGQECVVVQRWGNGSWLVALEDGTTNNIHEDYLTLIDTEEAEAEPVTGMTEQQMREEIERLREERRTLKDRVARAAYDEATANGWCSDFERGVHAAGLPLPTEEADVTASIPLRLRGMRGAGTEGWVTIIRQMLAERLSPEEIVTYAQGQGYDWVALGTQQPLNPWDDTHWRVDVTTPRPTDGETR